MTDSTIHDEAATPWPARPLLLALFGAVAAYVVQQLLRHASWPEFGALDPSPGREALSLGVAVGAVAFGFALERVRIAWTVAFAVVLGVAAGLVWWWNGGASHAWGDWHIASLFLAIAIAVPLFQTAREAGAARFDYRAAHGHAWTNVVLWFACWAFAGIAFALAYLLDALFGLVGVHVIRDLLREGWIDALLLGFAFGGSLGQLRERDGVVRLLQRVVTAVLGVLAPVLGAGLLLFLLILPFTGLHSLWQATRSTTPILLSCVIGALILANAVIGNGVDEEARNPVLRVGALGLAVAMLPLALLAALATGLRIGQYGMTPDRLWAVVFVAFACAYGLAYFVAVVRARAAWAEQARPANLRLAFAIAGVALLLATPLFSFNAISVADQAGRLETGRTASDKFDWAALAFDFGAPGKAALKRLAGSRDPVIAARAKQVAAQRGRWDVQQVDRTRTDADLLVQRLRVLPVSMSVPLALRTKLTDWGACGGNPQTRCTLLYTPGTAEAIVLAQPCLDDLSRAPDTRAGLPLEPRMTGGCGIARYRLVGDAWTMVGSTGLPLTDAQRTALKAGDAANRIEVRTVPARRVFVGGVAVGDPFE